MFPPPASQRPITSDVFGLFPSGKLKGQSSCLFILTVLPLSAVPPLLHRPPLRPPPIVQNHKIIAPMANWAVDPRPHVPRGFTLQDPVSRPLLRHEVYVAGCYSLHNEDLAIVKLQPPVHKDDFASLDSALRAFFEEMHRVRVAEIQPCPLGDAYVRFNTALEREKFLGPVFSFGNCSMTVIKHDEGDNVRSYDLDREAWVMLVGFPEDLKNGPIIAKAVSGFGILVY